MGFLKVSPAGTSTLLQFAGDVMNKLSDFLNGVNIAQTDSSNKPDIATETRFRDKMLRIFDNDRSNSFYFDTAAVNITEDKKIKIPALVASEDEPLFKDQPVIVSGKTIDALINTLQNIPKSALAAALANIIFFLDQDNALGAHYTEMSNMGGPTPPTSGKRKAFVNSTTGKYSVIRPDGVIVSLEENQLTESGGFAAAGTANLVADGSQTIFTIAHGLPQEPAYVAPWPTNAAATAAGIPAVSKDATNIILTYGTPPQAGTLDILWGAAYVNPDSITFTENTVNTMTNKEIPVDQNTIKHSTTNQVGDLLKNDGTKFQPMAKGTGGQLLRVNLATTDLEYVSPAFQFSAFVDFPKVSPPAHPDLETSRRYFKETDANNNAIATKFKINGAIREVLAW